jgi:hypothetical protein
MKIEDLCEAVDWDKKSEKQQIALVKRSWDSIRFLSNPSEAVQLVAVSRHGIALDVICSKGIEPSEAVQLAAVSEYGVVIQCIRTPSEAVQLAAVKNTGFAIEFIDLKLVTPAVIKIALTDRSYIISRFDSYTKVVQRLFANNSLLMKKWLRYAETMKYHNEELSEAVKPQTEREQLAAVNRSGFEIEFINNPSEAVQLAAVNQNASAIKYIINKGIVPSEAVQLAAVCKTGHLIKDIDNPSEIVQLGAISRDWRAIIYISNPTPYVVKTALLDQRFIDRQQNYERYIKNQFKDNALLMKKWLRYGETMRSQS